MTMTSKPIQSELESVVTNSVNGLTLDSPIVVTYNGLTVTINEEDLVKYLTIGLYRGKYWSKWSGQERKVQKAKDDITEKVLQAELTDEQKQRVDELVKQRLSNL